MQLIESLGARVTAVTLALDRQEKGQGELSAIQELEKLGVQVITIIRLDDIIQHIKSTSHASQLKAVAAYRERYGID